MAALAAVVLLLLPAPLAVGQIQPLATSGVDLAVSASGIALSSSFIVVGDQPWVNTTVENFGDTPANASLSLFLGVGATGSPFATLNFSIGASTTSLQSTRLNTSGLEGIRTVTARVAAVSPSESGALADNEASAEVRIHARFGEIDLSGNQVGYINTSQPRTAFVTVRDNASLTIGPGGNLSIEQLYGHQFDIRIEGNGLLRLSGGTVFASLPLRLVFADAASLVAQDNSVLAVSIRSTSSGALAFGACRVTGMEFEADRSAVTLDGTTLDLQRAQFSRASVTAMGSTLAARDPVEFLGSSIVSLRGTSTTVSSDFASAAEAEAAFPGISSYLSLPSVPYQPALTFLEGSNGTIVRSSIRSTITVGGSAHPSSVPLFATGGATATLARVAAVSVTDPTGAPVPNATVEVFDYIANSTLLATAGAPQGYTEVELAWYVMENGAAHLVGSYWLVASGASVASSGVALTFPLFPEFGPPTLQSDVVITLPLFTPWGLYAEDVPPVEYLTDASLSGEVLWTGNVYIRAHLALDSATATLAQSRDFERFVVVTDGGSLSVNGSTIRSNFAFNLYILNGSSAQLDAAGVVRGNLLMWNAGNLSLVGSRVVGSAIGNAQEFSLQGSFVWGRSIEISAGAITLVDTVLAAQRTITLQAPQVGLSQVAFSGKFVPFDALNRTALPSAEFGPIANENFEGLLDAPTVQVTAGALSAVSVTVWTQARAAFTMASAAAALQSLRLLALAVSFNLESANATMEGLNVPSGSGLSFTGAGWASVQRPAAPLPAVGPGVAVYWHAAVAVTVVDETGLPVPGATVAASPLSGGAEVSALTDELGIATLGLLSATITSAGSQKGPNYRVNATKDMTSSPTATWDPESTEAIVLRMPGSFASLDGALYFAALIPLGPSESRVLGTNLPDSQSLATFLSGFGRGGIRLNLSAPVFPGQQGDAFVAADYVYRQGPNTATRPMANQSVSFSGGTAAPATATLDEEGRASARFSLAATAGAHVFVTTVTAAGLASPVVASSPYTLTDLPKLAVVASKIKSTLNASESLFVIGQVTFPDGSPAPFATIAINYTTGRPPRVNVTNEGGSFFVQIVAPSTPGNYNLTIVATRSNAQASDPVVFPYVVKSSGAARPPTVTGGLNLLPIALGGTFFAACLIVFGIAVLQRRAARGAFVECGNCGKLTLASDKECRRCGVEFETALAKCSKCQTWIPANAAQCPQCHAVFSTRPEASEPVPMRPPAPTVDFEAPENTPLGSKRTPPARLEDLEFRLPGTTETVELGEKGSSPSFTAREVPTPAPRPPSSVGSLSPNAPLERMDLPRHEEEPSPVKEVSAMEGGEPTRREPVSLGTANVDLSRTTAAATSTKGDSRELPIELTDEVLREMLMKAAPELSQELLPGEIRKELQEIARSEAPVGAEKRAISSRERAPPARSGSADERAMEAPEKSRRSAFDVLQTPAKNIPAGFEKRGGTAGKDPGAKGAAAPVCPNCGGNWVVQRDGKNSCRVCGTRW